MEIIIFISVNELNIFNIVNIVFYNREFIKFKKNRRKNF